MVFKVYDGKTYKGKLYIGHRLHTFYEVGKEMKDKITDFIPVIELTRFNKLQLTRIHRSIL